MFSDRTWEDNRKKKRGLPMLAALLCGCGVKDIEEQAEASKNKAAAPTPLSAEVVKEAVLEDIQEEEEEEEDEDVVSVTPGYFQDCKTVGERGVDDAASCTSSMRPTRGLDDDGMTIATATTRDRMFFDCTDALDDAASIKWFGDEEDDDLEDLEGEESRMHKQLEKMEWPGALDGHIETDLDYYEKTGAPYPPLYEAFLKDYGRKKGPQMYKAMLQWRAEKGIDHILDKPYHEYWEFKKHAPDYTYGKTKSGSWVSYELTGRLDPGKMAKQGLKAEDIEYHIAWSNEFMRRVIDNGEDVGSMTVMDFKGFSLRKASSLFFITLTTTYGHVADRYYPGSMERLVVVNPPMGAKAIYKILMAVLPGSFKDKVVVTSDLRDLQKWIDPDQIPIEYGGTNPKPLDQSEVEVAIRAHLDKVNHDMGRRPAELDEPSQ